MAVRRSNGEGIRPDVALLLPNMGGGGAERVCLNLAKGFVKRNISCDLVLYEAVGSFMESVPPEVRVVNLGIRKARASVAPLVRYLRSSRPRFLVSALDHVNVAALIARRIADVATKTVVTVHITHSQASMSNPVMKDTLLRFFIRHTYRWADHIVSVSEGTADDVAAMTGIPRDRIQVIYNPVIGAEILEQANQPIDHPWLRERNSKLILAVGRLTRQKDFPTLIRAIDKVRSNRDVRLIILGEGEDRAALEDLVKSLNLSSHIALPGFAKNPYAWLKNCDLFVLSSAWEALPTVLIEAIALDVPVVSTDCPCGPREILKGGEFGRLVPVGDSVAMAQAINEALSGRCVEPPPAAKHPFLNDVAVEKYVALLRG